MTAKEPSPLQIQILREIAANQDATGRKIHQTLNERGFIHDRVRFYNETALLEDGELVEGFWENVEIGEGVTQARCFRITESGKRALSKALHTYEF